jgi:hypothetical protein
MSYYKFERFIDVSYRSGEPISNLSHASITYRGLNYLNYLKEVEY